jgi:hypothetical protein
MQNELHESFAQSVNELLADPLPAEPLRAGATAPNRGSQWLRPHHMNHRAACQVVERCTRDARACFLRGDRDAAAFQLGAATHYALDMLVPCPEEDANHAFHEGRFADTHPRIQYARIPPDRVADGRLVQHSIDRLLEVAEHGSPDYQARLREAHAQLQSIGRAIAADPVPEELSERADAASRDFARALGSQYEQYHAIVHKAVMEGLQRLSPGNPIRSGFWCGVIAQEDVFRVCREPGPLRLRVLALLGKRAFIRKALGALRLSFQAAGHQSDFERECRLLADRFAHRLDGLADRYQEWDWFAAPWDRWRGRADRALQKVFTDAEALRGQLARLEEERLTQECLDHFRERWPTSLSGRLAALMNRRPAAAIALWLAPTAAGCTGVHLLWRAGYLPSAPAAGAAVAIAVAFAVYVYRMSHNLRTLHDYITAQPQLPSRPELARTADADADTEPL